MAPTRVVTAPTYGHVQRRMSTAGPVVLVAGLPAGERIFGTLGQLAGLVPFIVVSDQQDPVRAARAVELGAEAYLPATEAGLSELSRRLADMLSPASGTVRTDTRSVWAELSQLKSVKRQHDALFDNMLNGFAYHRIILDDGGSPIDFEYLSANKELERLTGLDRGKIVGHTICETQPGFRENDFDLVEIYGKVALTGEPLSFEYYSKNLKRWLEIRAFSPEKYYFAVVFNDITERKRREIDTQELLNQKTTLLKEVHHRVKNNMQIIASLLNLQQVNAPEELADLIQESQDRVRSLSLVHEKLYQTEDFGRINLTEYLRDLARNLMGGGSAGSIELDVSGRKCPVDPQIAVVCGLIVTEAITNSTKYAFPSGANIAGPRIGLNMKRINGNVRVRISDNGVGFVYDPDQEPDTLGLTLIRELTKQARGSVTFDTSAGTTIQAILPADVRPAQAEGSSR